MSNYRDEFLADTYYLVSNKWFNNSVLFENSDDYKTFMLYVIENLLEYKWLVMSAYSILPDHFHFVIKNCESGLKLSDFMRKIQVSYAMYLKKRQENKPELRWVPVFEWRFRASPISPEEITNIESCVSFDPINHEFIEEIKDWPYSSIHQITVTWYDCMTHTDIKIYNEGRGIKTKFFTPETHQI